MREKKLHMFLTVGGEYISLMDMRCIRKNQFDDEDAVIDVLKGEEVPTNGIWGKKRKGGGIVVIDLAVKFNQETVGIDIENRNYNMPDVNIEVERCIVEEWHRLNKKRKKRLAKSHPEVYNATDN